MTSINFTFTDAISLYTKMFSNISAFTLIALAFVIFTIILMVNIDNSRMHFIFSALNILLIGYVCIAYMLLLYRYEFNFNVIYVRYFRKYYNLSIR